MTTWRRHPSLEEYFCVYCDQRTTGEDHVPAKSSYSIGIGDFIVVRACNRCNSLIGNKDLPTLKSRITFLRQLGIIETVGTQLAKVQPTARPPVLDAPTRLYRAPKPVKKPAPLPAHLAKSCKSCGAPYPSNHVSDYCRGCR